MKKFIAFILIIVMFGFSVELPELLKLPFLIHHYNEHKIKHPVDTVFAFLYKHYFLNQKPESQKDQRSDGQMPFKSVQTFNNHFYPFAFENKPEQVANNPVLWFYFPEKEMKTSAGFYSIWQPPKAV